MFSRIEEQCTQKNYYFFNHIFLDEKYNAKSEEQVIKELDDLLLDVGKELFLKAYDSYVEYPGYKYSLLAEDDYSLLGYLVQSAEYNNLSRKLIEIGVNLTWGMGRDGRKPPIVIALDNHNEEIAELLLDKAGIPTIDNFYDSILLKTQNSHLFSKIIQIAYAQGSIDTLLKPRSIDNHSLYEYFATKKNIERVNQLLTVANWHTYSNLKEFLHYSRQASWALPDEFQAWDRICEAIKTHLPRIPVENMEIEKDAYSFTLSEAYIALFGVSDVQITKPESKVMAIKSVLAQVYQLLADPRRCLPYLQFLNNEFYRYLRKTESSFSLAVEQSQFSFTAINDVWFPIPHSSYNGHHKNNALDKFLITFFEKHGIHGKSYQWVGFIPHEKADLSVKRGDYVKENQYGVGLLHGTLSHELQKAIFICAIDGNDIDLRYQEGNKISKITLHDLLAAFVSIEQYRAYKKVWMTIRDSRIINKISFIDPFRLHSFIMQQGPKYALHLLSNYLIDSFCKSFKKFHEAHCKVIRQTEFKDFIEQLNDLKIHGFPTTASMIEHVILQHKNKSNVLEEDSEKGYAIVAREYKRPYSTFFVKSYRQVNTGSSLSSEMALFNKAKNKFIEENRFHDVDLQQEYDKNHALVIT